MTEDKGNANNDFDLAGTPRMSTRIAFDPYIDFIEKQKWWKVGLDPANTNHLPRELATQLTEGPRKGRWADAHNARPPYHYIMVRGLAALAAAQVNREGD